MQLKFLGATGTVTGSKYLLEHAAGRVLVDCGLFQGLKALRLRNWTPLPVPAASLDAVVLTHAHLDHSGYLPLLGKQGFAGRVYCTEATFGLCRLLLPDSGYLQEEEAEYANRHTGTRNTDPLCPCIQAEGTRGAAIVAGAPDVKIHGERVPIRAEVVALDGLSAHADHAELIDWLRASPIRPSRTYITHAEPSAAAAMRGHVDHGLGWDAFVPAYGETVALD